MFHNWSPPAPWKSLSQWKTVFHFDNSPQCWVLKNPSLRSMRQDSELNQLAHSPAFIPPLTSNPITGFLMLSFNFGLLCRVAIEDTESSLDPTLTCSHRDRAAATSIAGNHHSLASLTHKKFPSWAQSESCLSAKHWVRAGSRSKTPPRAQSETHREPAWGARLGGAELHLLSPCTPLLAEMAVTPYSNAEIQHVHIKCFLNTKSFL